MRAWTALRAIGVKRVWHGMPSLSRTGEKFGQNAFEIQRANFSEFYSSNPVAKKEKTVKNVKEVILHGTPQELKDMLEDDSCNPNLQDEFKKTPLMYAAENNKCEMIQILLKFGVKLNLQDELGNTALMFAAQENNKDAARLLTDAGAQADILNYEQMTAAEVTLDEDIDAKIRDAKEPHTVEPKFK